MKFLLALIAAFFFAASSIGAAPNAHPYRWVYVSIDNLDEGFNQTDFNTLIKRIAAQGYTAIVLAAGFDRLDLETGSTYRSLNHIKAVCAQNKIEIIPCIMGLGYNGAFLKHDKNLAEGLPVRDALFIAGQDRARFTPDPAVTLENGNFEKVKDGKVQGFTFPPNPKPVASVDQQTVKEGKNSLRFENIDQQNGEAGRLVFPLNVKPNRLYRVRFWVKTEGLNASDPFGSGRFRVDVYGGEQKRQLNYFDPQIPATGDWEPVECGFNSKTFTQLKISIGVGEGKTGRFWLDDLKIEEVGMVNLLRRPGTPLTVKNEKTGTVYEEGKDFARVEDIQLDFLFDHDGPDIKLLPGSRIKEGDRLRVGFYHVLAIYQGQTPACMSEPKAFEIWRRQAELFHQVLNADKYFLGADEIRIAASCAACQARKMTAAQILGDCVTRQIGFIHEFNPNATIVLWSDMFDPTHNAKKTGYYYLADEDFYGAWDYIPKDKVIIAMWKYRDPGPSLHHFDSLGFKTVGAGYYDHDNLDQDVKFLDALDKSKNAQGIIYTTWLNEYGLLEDFAKLVNHRWGAAR